MLNYIPGTDPRSPWRESPIPLGETTQLDWDARLSIDMIRQHTKTDDIPGVTDDLLTLYRAVAVGAAEKYTGMLLFEQRTISEPIDGPMRLRPGKYSYKVRLRYTVADGIVYLYGGPVAQNNRPFQVKPNTRSIDVPVCFETLDLSNCCSPCAQAPYNTGMMASYRAGFSCPDAVPPGVVLGILQYVAWMVLHPGDELLTVRNRRDARSEGAMGTNNVAIASGALETWRILDEDIV